MPKKQQTDWGDWGIIAFLFLIGVWPVGLFLIFMKLFGNDGKKRDTAPPLYTGYQEVTRETTSHKTGNPGLPERFQRTRALPGVAGKRREAPRKR